MKRYILAAVTGVVVTAFLHGCSAPPPPASIGVPLPTGIASIKHRYKDVTTDIRDPVVVASIIESLRSAKYVGKGEFCGTRVETLTMKTDAESIVLVIVRVGPFARVYCTNDTQYESNELYTTLNKIAPQSQAQK